MWRCHRIAKLRTGEGVPVIRLGELALFFATSSRYIPGRLTTGRLAARHKLLPPILGRTNAMRKDALRLGLLSTSFAFTWLAVVPGRSGAG